MIVTDKPVFGLILAGGKSRRMGHDKALLDRDGQSLLAYVAELMSGFVDKVFVSTRADQEDDEERGKFAQIVDRYKDLGPVAGILSALEEYATVDWLVVACDLPNIDEQTLQHLWTSGTGNSRLPPTPAATMVFLNHCVLCTMRGVRKLLESLLMTA